MNILQYHKSDTDVSDSQTSAPINMVYEGQDVLEDDLGNLDTWKPEVDDSMPNVDLSETCLKPQQKQKFTQFLRRNRGVFAIQRQKLGARKLVEHVIGTGTHKPVRVPPYKTNPQMKAELDKILDELLEQDVI